MGWIVLLQSEVNGEDEAHTYVLVTHSGRLPLRHELDYAKCLLGEVVIGRTYNLGIYDGAIGVHHEAYGYATLDVLFLADGRVLDVLAQPLIAGSIATGELSVDLYDIVYLVIHGSFYYGYGSRRTCHGGGSTGSGTGSNALVDFL